MPLWLKRYTLNLLNEYYREKESTSPPSSIDESSQKPLIPDVVSKSIKSTYNTKLPKN